MPFSAARRLKRPPASPVKIGCVRFGGGGAQVRGGSPNSLQTSGLMRHGRSQRRFNAVSVFVSEKQFRPGEKDHGICKDTPVTYVTTNRAKFDVQSPTKADAQRAAASNDNKMRASSVAPSVWIWFWWGPLRLPKNC